MVHGAAPGAGKTRANLQPVDTFTLPSGTQLQKISPLADWTTSDVWHYAAEHHPTLVALRQGLHQHRLRALHQSAL